MKTFGKFGSNRARALLAVDFTRRDNAFFENAFFENAFFENFANFWRARSRLYQNEILQENMRSTAFSSSTRFASFCTAAISKFSQKIGLKKQQFS